jgi:hypothetical protein
MVQGLQARVVLFAKVQLLADEKAGHHQHVLLVVALCFGFFSGSRSKACILEVGHNWKRQELLVPLQPEEPPLVPSAVQLASM